jgi:hypothetical protein
MKRALDAIMDWIGDYVMPIMFIGLLLLLFIGVPLAVWSLSHDQPTLKEVAGKRTEVRIMWTGKGGVPVTDHVLISTDGSRCLVDSTEYEARKAGELAACRWSR